MGPAVGAWRGRGPGAPRAAAVAPADREASALPLPGYCCCDVVMYVVSLNLIQAARSAAQVASGTFESSRG